MVTTVVRAKNKKGSVGRPATGGGRDVSLRLTPYLITQLGIKKTPYIKNKLDSDLLRILVMKSVNNIQLTDISQLDSPILDINPVEAEYGVSTTSGWSANKRNCTIWIPNDLEDEIIGCHRKEIEALRYRLASLEVTLETASGEVRDKTLEATIKTKELIRRRSNESFNALIKRYIVQGAVLEFGIVELGGEEFPSYEDYLSTVD